MSTPARRAALLDRIHTRKARVGVIGLGYVGLPLAVEFARAGFDVTGFDVDPEKVAVVNAGGSYIPDVPPADLAAAVAAGRLRATSDMAALAAMRNVGDVRESPALDILELLTRRGAVVSYTDPHVASVRHGGSTLDGVPFTAAVANPYDCAVVATDHDAFDYARIAAMPLVVDTRNALKGFDRASILRL